MIAATAAAQSATTGALTATDGLALDPAAAATSTTLALTAPALIPAAAAAQSSTTLALTATALIPAAAAGLASTTLVLTVPTAATLPLDPSNATATTACQPVTPGGSVPPPGGGVPLGLAAQRPPRRARVAHELPPTLIGSL